MPKNKRERNFRPRLFCLRPISAPTVHLYAYEAEIERSRGVSLPMGYTQTSPLFCFLLCLRVRAPVLVLVFIFFLGDLLCEGDDLPPGTAQDEKERDKQSPAHNGKP